VKLLEGGSKVKNTKLKVSAAILNGTGVSVSIEEKDEDDCGDSIALVERLVGSPQKACKKAAEILRDAANRMDVLAEEPTELIFKEKTHVRINAS
jgi:hypothetical protein